MLWVLPLLVGCRIWTPLEANHLCEHTADTVAWKTWDCTADQALAEARAEVFADRYVCDVRRSGQSVDFLHECIDAISDMTCDEVARKGDDLDEWLEVSPACPLYLALPADVPDPTDAPTDTEPTDVDTDPTDTDTDPTDTDPPYDHGNAALLPGATEGILLPPMPNLNGFAIEFWVKVDIDARVSILEDDVAGARFELQLNSEYHPSICGSVLEKNNSHYLRIGDTSGTLMYRWNIPTIDITDGQWHHIAITQSLVGDPNTMKFIVDGTRILNNTLPDSTCYNIAFAPVSFDGLAFRPQGGNDLSLDGIKLWKRGLTNNEQVRDWGEGADPSDPDLIGWYECEDLFPLGVGTGAMDLQDSSNQGNHVDTSGTVQIVQR